MTDKNDDPPLFTLSAADAEAQVTRMFAAHVTAYPIRTAIASALMIGEAATQRIASALFDRSEAGERLPDLKLFETIERLDELLFESVPNSTRIRLDLLSWDASGYIFGWYIDNDGKTMASQGSCPETVRLLSNALSALAPFDEEWSMLLKHHATVTAGLWAKSRERAEQVAAERVARQGWWGKLTKPMTIEKELISLGFYDSNPFFTT